MGAEILFDDRILIITYCQSTSNFESGGKLYESFWLHLPLSRAVDPDSLNPDPDTDPDLIRIKGFDDHKLKKINITENLFKIFFWSKIAIYLCSSCRRSLQPSKENILQPSKNEIY
jgi:hypothetical protein